MWWYGNSAEMIFLYWLVFLTTRNMGGVVPKLLLHSWGQIWTAAPSAAYAR
jgi:hypothetical protein